MVNEDSQLEVLNLLSEQIIAAMRSLSNEQHAPRLTADDSDDFIKEQKERVSTLRDVRESLELCYTGASL